MPSAGIGPQPKIKSGDSGISSTTPMQTASEGTSMLPVPRMMLASAFISQTSTLPPNTTFEYCIAASSAPPSAPIARYSGRPQIRNSAAPIRPIATLSTTACITSASAS